jgi:hypothetical protein
MTEEEKFVFDLDGYLVIKNVLSPQELDDLNALVDEYFADSDNEPLRDLNKISNWGQATKNLIDHPKVLPYLVELLGPKVRIDHDYAIIMNEGDARGGLHGGPGLDGDHWFKYRDGQMRNGLSVVTFFLADANAGDGGFACVPGSHKTNFLNGMPRDVRLFERGAHYVDQPTAKAGDALFFTEALIHGTMPWRAKHQRRTLLYKYSPGHSTWAKEFYNLDEYSELTERQQRMMATPSIHNHPEVVQADD